MRAFGGELDLEMLNYSLCFTASVLLFTPTSIKCSVIIYYYIIEHIYIYIMCLYYIASIL